MHKQSWLVLIVLLSAAPMDRAAAGQVEVDEQLLKSHNLKPDGPALLSFFQDRTLSKLDKVRVQVWIEQLGANSFRVREQASQKLVARGPVVVELLLRVKKHPPDLEVRLRAEQCIDKIRSKDFSLDVPAAAARLIRDRKPKGAARVLLAYLPFADNGAVADEVRKTLQALSVRNGKTDEQLVQALDSTDPVIRAAAGEALAHTADAGLKKTVRKLMKDESALVRYRVARGLAVAKDPEAIRTLIQSVPELSRVHALQVEDILLQLAKGAKHPTVSLGGTKAALEKFRRTWVAWWDKTGKKLDLAKKEITPRVRGFTVVVLLDDGVVMELGRENKARWKLTNVDFPLDVQILPNGNILLAEYNSLRVTERNLQGQIVWSHKISGAASGPLVAQRLPNGNTFIGTNTQLLEIDKNGKTVFSFTFGGLRIRKSVKLPNGNIACLRDDSRVLIIDPTTRRELSGFTVQLGKPLFGGRIDVLKNGNVLIPHNMENKVVEYDKNGNVIWTVKVEQPVAARRLANGNTLVTTMVNRVVEVDRNGNEVWEFRSRNSRVTRALRR